MIVVQLCDYTKNHRSVPFKWVNFMRCELYPNKATKKESTLLWMLFSSAVLNSLMGSRGILDFLCIISWHLQTVTVVFLPFQFGALLFIFLI